MPVLPACPGVRHPAGCGSSSPQSTGVRAPNQAYSQNSQAQILRFADCMRTHGVPDLPDPGTPGFKNVIAQDTPAVRSAYAGCHQLQPGGGPPNEREVDSPAQIAAMLAFARCIRNHGFGDFPDPTSSGITHEMIAAAGINLQQPALVQAADACATVTHGYITKAVIARFIAGH